MMRILYSIEEYDYTLNEIEGFIDDIAVCIKKNIIKKKGDRYKFNYVGMIVDKTGKQTSIVIVLPKYLEDIVLSVDTEKNYAQLLMQVFRKYTRDSLIRDNLSDLDYLSDCTHFSLLAIIDYLVGDYIENGLYQNSLDSHECNGNGPIDWNHTMQEEFALVSNRQIFYTNLHTIADEDDTEDYIRLLHQNILFQCFSFLEEISFLDILEYPSLYIRQAQLFIDDLEYQVRAIDLEMRNVFSDRKINLLKAMKYFLEKESRLESNNLLLYGTINFHNIWEEAISSVLDNERSAFTDYLPSPQWTKRNLETILPSRTLRPDAIRKISNDIFVVDAKYYKYPFNENGKLNSGNPGLGDISKQFLYVEALKTEPSIEDCNYHNSFLFPSSNDTVTNIGEINFNLFPQRTIQLITFPGKQLFKMYIAGQQLDDVEIVRIFQ